MSYKLEYPYTEEERANFIVEYNHNQGLLIEEVENIVEIPSSHYEPSYDEDGNFVEEVLVEDIIQENMPTLYALEPNEIMVDGKPTINPDYEEEQAKEREKLFKTAFFEIPPIEGIFKGGFYRKVPKGYQSAVESINTAFNAVTVIGLLPQDYLIFYAKPDFTDETQCTEDWLVANQFKNETMTAQEFGQFYMAFMTGWNNREHKEVE